jgi:hypothetical protein
VGLVDGLGAQHGAVVRRFLRRKRFQKPGWDNPAHVEDFCTCQPMAHVRRPHDGLARCSEIYLNKSNGYALSSKPCCTFVAPAGSYQHLGVLVTLYTSWLLRCKYYGIACTCLHFPTFS